MRGIDTASFRAIASKTDSAPNSIPKSGPLDRSLSHAVATTAARSRS